MSEVTNVTDKFLKHKLKMNSENKQFWHREQDTVYDRPDSVGAA